VRHWLNIVVLAGLAVTLLAGAAHAVKRNPWTMYQRGFTYGTTNPPAQNPGTAQVAPQQRPAWQAPVAPATPVAPFGNQYAPLPAERQPNVQRGWPGYQPYPYGYPNSGGYGGYNGYGGGQFGFGMNFSPGFGFSGMPFFGGGNSYGGYGNPYGGFSPWGMGFPMF
jgi:uncharacterized membrane protein YgcG